MPEGTWPDKDGFVLSLRFIAERRQWVESGRQYEAEKRKELESTPEYTAWSVAHDARVFSENALAEAEDKLKTEARLAPVEILPTGITVKMFSVVSYVESAAREWCQKFAPNFLVLDTKRFEKAVKEGVLTDAPATATKEPRVQLASDLSAYL